MARSLKRHAAVSAAGGLALLAIITAEWILPRNAGSPNVPVVINEIFYNSGEDTERLEWLELHNPTRITADVGGWRLLDGISCVLPRGASIPPDGYLVLCSDHEAFQKAYGRKADGEFSRSLSNEGERIQLADARGQRVDTIRYGDSPPWPSSPDGYSASLERICPQCPGEVEVNWAPSPLSANVSKPGGTPGARNAANASSLPPFVTQVTFSPRQPPPGQPLQVRAEIAPPSGDIDHVELLYRTAMPGEETAESSVPMEKVGGAFAAIIPGQADGSLIRFRIRATNRAGSSRIHPSPNDLQPALSAYVSEAPTPHTIPLAFIIHVGREEYEAARSQGGQGRFGPPGFGGFGPPPGFGGGFGPRFGPQSAPDPLPPQGRSAFVYRAPDADQFQLFDFVNVTSRKGGYKVRLGRNRSLRGITTLNIINEGSVGFALAELAAYELYRRVGNPTPQSEMVRLVVDGRVLGYHLAFEQPNKGFLRRNGIDDRGNLYKIQWMGRSLVDQHEKKTRLGAGHDDLIAVVEALGSTRDEAQWEVIQENFNVPEVANYFAVNTALSHWDGFFNNYFTYHDSEGSGKWELYPWDQDKSGGYYDGLPPGETFFDMPLTFGMEGDAPPGSQGRQGGGPGFGMFGGPPGFGGGAMWWRAGGHFSRPLLANPGFRRVFLLQVRDIAENVFTEEAFFPYLDRLRDTLLPEAVIRAEALGNDPSRDIQDVEQGILDLKNHLTKRRQFLLSQKEILVLP